jgi:GTPase KRas protein
MRCAEGFLLVFSINDRSSFERIKDFHEQILRVKDVTEGNVPMILVGNKSDLESKREVTTDEAVQYSKQINIQCMESSAKARINVDEAFLILVKQIKKNRTLAPVPLPEKDQSKNCIIS